MTQLLLLASQHSVGLVLLAALVCALMAGLVIGLAERTRALSGSRRLGWMATIAVVGGVGVWTTHFVAMLGFRPDLTLGYDPLLTLLSAALAIAAVGLPLAAAAAVPRRAHAIGCSVLAGLGIGAMHFTGMMALQGCVAAHDTATVFVALGLGASFSALAFSFRPSGWRFPAACLLLVLAVCSLHFTAVAGVTLRLQPIEATDFVFEPAVLGILVAAAALMLFTIAFIVAISQIRLEARDIRQARALARNAELLSTALHNMSNGLVMIGADGRINLFNNRAVELLHMSPGDIAEHMPWRRFIANVALRNNWDEDWVERAVANYVERMSRSEVVRVEQNFDNGDVLSVSCRPVDGGAILTFDDVTSEREIQNQMAHMAHHDALTGLANRRAFQLNLERAITRSGEVSLLMIDLDRFKEVNDSFGHASGDSLLVKVAERLRQACGPTEFLARLGGDELAIVQEGADREAAEALAALMIAVLSHPFEIDGTRLGISCSIGIAETRGLERGTDAPDMLMQQADIALYRAKASGRGRFQRFEAGMLEETLQQRRLEADIAAALEKDQFTLAYQPLFDVVGGGILGFEALIRWKHPERGFVSPAEFIPGAERTGQIGAIGEWVLQEACRQAALWPSPLHVAINVSPLQLHSAAFLAHVTRALSENDLTPDRLEIELTETAMVEDGVQIAASLSALRALGVKVAMDDFGTGYSSLAHLRHFELDRIKIDRSFVDAAPTDRGAMAVLRAVTQIGQELGVTTIGEGIETREQFEILRSLGCDAVQGYFLGRPLSADEVSLLVTGTQAA